MSVWLLSHLKDSPGNRIFSEEGARRGHPVLAVDAATLAWRCGQRGCDFPLAGGPPRIVFPRMGSSASESQLYSVLAAESAGWDVVNRYAALKVCRDKAQTYLRLQAAGVPFPDTMWLGGDWTWQQVLDQCGPPPHIVKLATGTKGQGVLLSESRRSLLSIVETLRCLGAPVLVQRFLTIVPGCDTRLLVVGGKVRGAATRQAQSPEEFRSNLHLGGSAQIIEPESRQVQIAEDAVRCLGLEVAGVDLLEAESGPVVIEVNGSPGLEASPFFVKHIWDYLEPRIG